MQGVESLAESIQTALNEELSKAGALSFLDIGDARQAALAAYRWLLKESLPKGRQSTTANLYDLLSYLLVQGERLGFSYDTKIKQGKMLFVKKAKMKKARSSRFC